MTKETKPHRDTATPEKYNEKWKDEDTNLRNAMLKQCNISSETENISTPLFFGKLQTTIYKSHSAWPYSKIFDNTGLFNLLYNENKQTDEPTISINKQSPCNTANTEEPTPIDTSQFDDNENAMERDIGKLLAESEHTKERMASLGQEFQAMRSDMRADIRSIQSALQQDRIALQDEVRKNIAEMSASLQRDRIASRQELHEEFNNFKQQIEKLDAKIDNIPNETKKNNRATMWATAALVVAIVGTIAAVFIYVISDIKSDIKEIQKSTSTIQQPISSKLQHAPPEDVPGKQLNPASGNSKR